MLRKSIYILRLSLVVTVGGFGWYLLQPNYGKYLFGTGLILLSAGLVSYLFFMFKRYGEKRGR